MTPLMHAASSPEAGAELIVADMDPARVAEAERACGATVASPSTIYNQPADLFAPCALGAILDAETVPRLKAKITSYTKVMI